MASAKFCAPPVECPGPPSTCFRFSCSPSSLRASPPALLLLSWPPSSCSKSSTSLPCCRVPASTFTSPRHPSGSYPIPLWADAASRYRQIILVPSDNPDTDWYRLAFFAADHGMSINHGYFARMNWNNKEAAQPPSPRRPARPATTSPTPSIYLTTDESRRLLPQQSIRQIDGYSVFAAPGIE